MGKKLVYNPSRESSFIIGDRFLDRIVFLNYTSIPVDRLPLVAGKQILPIYPVVVIVIPLALWYIVLVAASATVSGAQGAWAWVTWLAAEFMSLSLWIPITIVVGFALLSLLIWGIREFRKSEIYGLMLMSFMAGIDKICPIIPVK